MCRGQIGDHPFPSPQLDQEPLANDSPMAGRARHGNCVVWGINCHFGAASPACRSVEHSVVRPCQESSGIFLEILSHLSAPRTLFAHLPAPCVCVVCVCGIGLSSRPIAADSLLVSLLTDLLCNLLSKTSPLSPLPLPPSDCLSSDDGSYAPTAKPARDSHFWNPSGIDAYLCLSV